MRWPTTVAVAALACLGAGLVLAAVRDGAIIRNSGSTNVPGYTVKIWSDGEASSGARTWHVSQDLADRFFRDVKAARDGHASAEACMKSASFGSTTVVEWHTWTSPDLSCPGDPLAQALAADVQAVTNGIPLLPGRRIPLPGHEPRKPERPSPSPENHSSPA